MKEEWRPVVGYEGLYEVSSWGRVRSLDRTVNRLMADGRVLKKRLRGKVLKQTLDKSGRLYVFPCEGGRARRMYVHQAVARAFHANPDNLETVNHKDLVPTNNRADNLEWMSRLDNVRHAYAAGVHSPVLNPKRRNKLTPEAACELRRRYASGENVNSLAQEFGVTSGVVSKVGQGRAWIDPANPPPRLAPRPLTEEQRLEVGRRRVAGVPVKALSAKFGIKKSQVFNCRALFIQHSQAQPPNPTTSP